MGAAATPIDKAALAATAMAPAYDLSDRKALRYRSEKRNPLNPTDRPPNSQAFETAGDLAPFACQLKSRAVETDVATTRAFLCPPLPKVHMNRGRFGALT